MSALLVVSLFSAYVHRSFCALFNPNIALVGFDCTLVSRGEGGGGGYCHIYMGYIGMCRCEGYGFQEVYSSIGYINQSVWVKNRVSFFRKLTSWLKILSRLSKPGIATQNYKKMKSASLNFHDSASTAQTLLDIIKC